MVDFEVPRMKKLKNKSTSMMMPVFDLRKMVKLSHPPVRCRMFLEGSKELEATVIRHRRVSSSSPRLLLLLLVRLTFVFSISAPLRHLFHPDNILPKTSLDVVAENRIALQIVGLDFPLQEENLANGIKKPFVGGFCVLQRAPTGTLSSASLFLAVFSPRRLFPQQQSLDRS
ncbi:unnamed protein product [Caenorhabditis auriculariae]|uniref:Uncharacterized protein n=1 Tax=Caenorhabditis auriculariae TaxID=2777116 RepID=A0A8S1HC36_9PELO|nr:unnamed protein product [Caenorhabditis auriculariae]